MGNARSAEVVRDEDIWWTNATRHETQAEQQNSTATSAILETINAESECKKTIRETTILSEREQRKKEMEEDFIKFKQELARKHERRRQLIVEKKKEMTDLRDDLIREKEENNRLRKLLEKNRTEETDSSKKSNQEDKLCDSRMVNSIKEENEDLRNEVARLKLALDEKEMIAEKNKELRISLAEMQKELQSVNTQVISFEKERIDYQEHVTALKDIIKVSKEMLRVRESQIDELKKKIKTIEELLASKEINILSDDLRQEYERQLRNIRDLRNLYEDRQRADRREKENLHSIIDDLKKKIEDEENKNRELTERVNELEEDNSKKYDKIVNLESNFGLVKAECRELHAEMNIINQLFSHILISFNNDQDIDLNNMIKTLEENHDLLTNIVINDESSETSALPKVLLDLIKQVNESNKKDNTDDPAENEKEKSDKSDKLDIIQEVEENPLSGGHQLNSPEEIVENLPKVWRVLIELLSHQSPPNNEITEKKGENDSHCYKSVETPTGLRKVLSVSKTFIRLKSLILEKKGLEKEMTRLKQLNTHLEGRLSDQEKRLVLVSSELSKTWNFVGKMQKQHQQLHTQEKILRYELAQKRKLLTELKEELEYCRQKWVQARKQNSSTEEQWKQLRSEFASRKTSVNDNSVESGFSDDKSSSDEEEANFAGKSGENKKALIPSTNDISRNENSQIRTIEDTNSVDTCENLQPEAETSSETLNNKEIQPASADDFKPEEVEIRTQESCLYNRTETSTVDLDSVNVNAANLIENNLLAENSLCSEVPDTEISKSSHRNLTSDSANSSDPMDTEPQISSETLNKEEISLTSAENIPEEDEIQALEVYVTSTIGLDSVRTDAGNPIDNNLVDNNIQCNEIPNTEISPQGSLSSVNLNSSGTKKTEADAIGETGRLNSEIIESIPTNNDSSKPNLEDDIYEENQGDSTTQHSTESKSTTHIETTLRNNKVLLVDLSGECVASSSQNAVVENSERPTCPKNPVEAASEFAARREERMKKLEEQCNELFFSVAKTSLRGMVMSNKLDNLHEMYGDNSQAANGDVLVTQENDDAAECVSSPVTDSSENNENNQE